MKRIFIKPTEGYSIHYTIVANTGETIGTANEDLNCLEERIKVILYSDTLLQELCPDSDITEITSLHIEAEMIGFPLC